MKNCVLFLAAILTGTVLYSQNTGIGTSLPEAKLHVNGDIKLQYGSAVNKISRDSNFTDNSHLNIPTEKAIRDFIQKGSWVAADFSVPGPQAPVGRSFAVLDADNATSIATKGNLAFVLSANVSRLSIVDVSNPDVLVRKGSTGTNLDFPTSVAVQGNYAYITSAQNNRLCIFDISNPDIIVARGFTSTGLSFPRCVVVQGNYAYVASDDIGRISVFDISNPDNIIARATGGVALSTHTSLFVQGNYLYATSYAASELQIYDISNPSAVVYKTFTNTNLSGPRALEVVGNFAYVASRENNRLCIFDVSNPNTILPRSATSINLSQPNSVKVIGNYAFVSSEGNDQICMYDVSNPISILSRGFSTAHLSQPTGLAVSGNYIVAANQGNNRNVCVYDLDISRSAQLTSEGWKTVSDAWKTEGINVFRTNGSVGIRKQFPTQALDVNGNIAASGTVSANTITGNNISGGQINASGSIVGTDALLSAQLGFANNLGTKLQLYTGSSGPVGIGVYNNEFRHHTDYAGADFTFGFQFTNGSFTERFRIKGNGNVGIGISNPGNPLSFPAVLGKKISLYPGATGDVGMAVEGNDFRLYTDNNLAKVSIGYSQYAGNFYQNNLDVYANGNAWLRGTLTQASDLRLKKNIMPITGALASIEKINGYHYHWKDERTDSSMQSGLIAQELQQVLPELVKQNEMGELSVNYTGLIPVLIESIKELKQRTERQLSSQQQQIIQLQEQIQQLLNNASKKN